LLAWLRLATSSSARFGAASPTQLCETFRTSSRVAEIRAQLAPCTPVEVWFQDEMRVGQKNKLTYRWAMKGSRPRAAHDQRTQSTYLFGAVCPERGWSIAGSGCLQRSGEPTSFVSLQSYPVLLPKAGVATLEETQAFVARQLRASEEGTFFAGYNFYAMIRNTPLQ
jgi:hypothetical protein